ncbi:MAG: 1-acyl-sn-glycerol-3-phosphate acyltransferase [Bacteroidales bacterium]|nr:1-acyl-sn-glycerol-3-phosphate acyltransferase [Bacteroidales bacterium]MBN2819347.1 1-acyl-sn-glycerol-3-phosphate acyltransferase [Bacteroidales bacterium]
MGRENIDKWSLFHFVLKNLWAKPVHSLYYNKIKLRNASVIKTKESVIIAPNHQNALMDPLAVVIKLPFQTAFLARADVFRKGFIENLLTKMKIMPVYRIRDGISSLNKNEEIFEYSAKILENKRIPLCLFPEGNHGKDRRLRPLVKGIFRIAFKAQAKFGNKPGVKIVPTGIDYTHYQKFQQDLFINVGTPIEVADYWDMYVENEALATNALRDKLAEEMSKVMIDIQSEEYYDTIMGLRYFYRPVMYKKLGVKKDSLAKRFDTDKMLIDKLNKAIEEKPEAMEGIKKEYVKYARLRDKLNLRDWVLRKEKYSIIGNLLLILTLVPTLPFWLYGYLANWPHYIFPPKFAKKVKDPQFVSTAKWGVGMVIQAIYYLIILMLGLIFLPAWWMALVLLVSLPFAGKLAYRIRVWFVKIKAKLRYSSRLKNNAELLQLKEIRNSLIEMLETIV